jgi:hypothetical protein
VEAVDFGDVHTATIGDGIDLTVWRAMGTRKVGESIDAEFLIRSRRGVCLFFLARDGLTLCFAGGWR